MENNQGNKTMETGNTKDVEIDLEQIGDKVVGGMEGLGLELKGGMNVNLELHGEIGNGLTAADIKLLDIVL